MSIRFTRFDREFFLLVIGSSAPTDDEWRRWLRFIDEDRDYRKPRVLVHSDGGAPTTAQRKELARIMHDYPTTRVAVLVDSVAGRGAVTALSWLYGGFKAFKPDAVEDALTYLERPPEQAEAVRKRLTSLCTQIRA